MNIKNFFSKFGNSAAYPIPTHIQAYFIPIGDGNSEFEVTGEIQCSCGNKFFEVWDNNSRHVIKLICGECGKQIELFDSDKHGWDGFVCGNNLLDREEPFEKYNCSDCKNDRHSVVVKINSQGKDDFIEECSSNDQSFSKKDWVNAFEWITVSLTCKKCNLKVENWLDLETM